MRIVCLFIGFCLSISAFAQQTFSYQQVLDADKRAPDSILKYGDNSHQTLHVWQGDDQPNRAVFFIHGGCWLSAYDIEHSYALTSALNQHGYTVYSAEYRRTGDSGGGWPVTYQDIQQAFAFAQAQQPDVHWVVSGHSAGGHLALLLAADATLSEAIERVIGLAAITNIETYAAGTNSCQRVTEAFMGGTVSDKADAYAAANPAKHAMRTEVVLLQGSADTIVPPNSVQAIPEATVKAIDGAGHFDLIHPQSDAFKVLLDVLQDSQHDPSQ